MTKVSASAATAVAVAASADPVPPDPGCEPAGLAATGAGPLVAPAERDLGRSDVTRGVPLGEDAGRSVGGDVDRGAEVAEQLGEALFVDHHVFASSGVTSAVSPGLEPNLPLASCRRLLTVPGRRWMAVAISRSDSPA